MYIKEPWAYTFEGSTVITFATMAISGLIAGICTSPHPEWGDGYLFFVVMCISIAAGMLSTIVLAFLPDITGNDPVIVDKFFIRLLRWLLVLSIIGGIFWTLLHTFSRGNS